MTARTSTSAAGDTSGRPARTGRGEHPRENLLSLNPGAGPTSVEDAMARPVRFDDPERNAASWVAGAWKAARMRAR